MRIYPTNAYGGRRVVEKGIRKFTADETAAFCAQIAMLLNGGITLYEGLNLFYEEMEESPVKAALKAVDEKLENGSSLSEAIRETGAFPEYMIGMTEVGERTGKLEDVMNALSVYYERESAVSASIKNVITYPAMLFSMMAVILIALVAKVLPMFNTVFEELDNKTPGTVSMMSTSLNVSRVAAAIVFVIVIVLLGVIFVYRIRNGADQLGSIVNKLPFTAGLAERLGKDKFLAALSVMVSSGIETGEAVERAAELPDDEGSKVMVREAVDLMRAGEPLDSVLYKSGLLSGIESRMVNVGIKSGSLDKVLEKLSERHDEEIGGKLNGLSAGIEVALVVILTVLVGVILLMVMMPLISVIASI